MPVSKARHEGCNGILQGEVQGHAEEGTAIESHLFLRYVLFSLPTFTLKFFFWSPREYSATKSDMIPVKTSTNIFVLIIN